MWLLRVSIWRIRHTRLSHPPMRTFLVERGHPTPVVIAEHFLTIILITCCFIIFSLRTCIRPRIRSHLHGRVRDRRYCLSVADVALLQGCRVRHFPLSGETPGTLTVGIVIPPQVLISTMDSSRISCRRISILHGKPWYSEATSDG
jgi:hypothetical protein